MNASENRHFLPAGATTVDMVAEQEPVEYDLDQLLAGVVEAVGHPGEGDFFQLFFSVPVQFPREWYVLKKKVEMPKRRRLIVGMTEIQTQTSLIVIMQSVFIHLNT